MGKRPKRNIILFLVEGKSDREALKLAIPELYWRIDESFEVYFPVIVEDEQERGGDITSKYSVWPRNIEDKIYEFFLRDFFDKEKILPKDVSEIIQIVDMDGVFVPDELIIEGSNPSGEDKPFYSDDSILTQRVESIVKRNEHKRENLKYLCSQNTIKVKQKTVKYSVYYFSANLDHFLHNDANLDTRMKCLLADAFSSNYIDRAESFVRDIADDPDATTQCDYKSSWDFICEEGKNSLHRHTNINLLLNGLISRISDWDKA